jgi:hypothetical protein
MRRSAVTDNRIGIYENETKIEMRDFHTNSYNSRLFYREKLPSIHPSVQTDRRKVEIATICRVDRAKD